MPLPASMEGCDTGSTQNVVVISPQRPVLQQNLLGVKVLGLPLLLVRGFQFVRRSLSPQEPMIVLVFFWLPA